MKKVTDQIAGWYFRGVCREKITPLRIIQVLLWMCCLFFAGSFLHTFWYRPNFPGRAADVLFMLTSGAAAAGIFRLLWTLPVRDPKSRDWVSTVLAALDGGLFFDLLLTPLFMKLVVSHPLILLFCFLPAPAGALVFLLRRPLTGGTGVKTPVLALMLLVMCLFYFFLWVKMTGIHLASPGTNL